MSKIQNLPNAAPRIIAEDVTKLGIKNYGEDNGYPQRMLNMYNASGSANMCAKLCASYIVGKGFEDKTFYKSKINDKGLTPDKLIRQHAHDKAKLRGIALHINYNSIYQVESVNYVPFEHCRLGIGENINKIAISPYWFSNDPKVKKLSESDISFIDKWNPDPLYIEKQVERADGWENYKGQLLWLSDDFESYPLATVDPVLNDLQAEIESGITRRNNLRGNFQLKAIWVDKGNYEDDQEAAENIAEIQKFIGPEGNPLCVVSSTDPDEKDVPKIISVPTSINDKLFEYTDSSARLAIYTAFSQPAILHSDYKGTNGYNEGQLPQCMAYYNAYTDPDRIFFEEVYTEVFSRFKENINPSGSYRITQLSTVSTTDLTTEADKPLIETIGIGGVQALQAILADSATTPEQKKNTLVVVFGIKPEDADLLAGIKSGTIATPEE